MCKPTNYRDRVIAMVRNRPASLQLSEIANATNNSLSWVRQFARGEIANPGVNNVEAIDVFLTNFKPKA